MRSFIDVPHQVRRGIRALGINGGGPVGLTVAHEVLPTINLMARPCLPIASKAVTVNVDSVALHDMFTVPEAEMWLLWSITCGLGSGTYTFTAIGIDLPGPLPFVEVELLNAGQTGIIAKPQGTPAPAGSVLQVYADTYSVTGNATARVLYESIQTEPTS